MPAIVVPYNPDAWDPRPRICIECLECSRQWGWTYDTREHDLTLRRHAHEHNDRFHPRRGTPRLYVADEPHMNPRDQERFLHALDKSDGNQRRQHLIGIIQGNPLQ
jgi:hypothetical protein